MKKILLPTDFSDNSWNAIKYALQLYKDQECNFILLHTYTPIVYHVEHLQASYTQLQVIDALKETAKKRLDDTLQRINSEFNNTKHIFSQVTSFNTLTSEIEELYRGGVIDVIITGTKGASGVKEILFGSNTVHIIKNARCPIFAIPSGFSYEAPHEILFPTDLDILFKHSKLKILKVIVQSNNARLNVMHVSSGNELTEKQKRNQDNLESIFKNSAFLFHNVKPMNIAHAINEFQVKHKINLLVMINNKHSFFENLFFKNTINRIGFHLNVPFLVIPNKL